MLGGNALSVNRGPGLKLLLSCGVFCLGPWFPFRQRRGFKALAFLWGFLPGTLVSVQAEAGLKLLLSCGKTLTLKKKAMGTKISLSEKNF